MKAFVLCLSILMASSASLSYAKAKSFDQMKTDAMNKLNQKESALKTAKSCIDSATEADELKKCEKKLREEMKRCNKKCSCDKDKK